MVAARAAGCGEEEGDEEKVKGETNKIGAYRPELGLTHIFVGDPTVRQDNHMEPIDRHFRPGFWRLLVPLLIVSILMVFLTVLVSTAFEVEYPWVSNAVGILFAGYALTVASLFVALILTRMRLYSDGSTLDASLSFFGISFYRRSLAGRSWHAIARPGRPQMEIEGIGSYRIEIATSDGERISFLGPVLCWFFRIECL